MDEVVLVIFAGLPGAGKSSVARALAERLGATYLRIDSIEQAMRDGGISDGQIGGIGYGVAQRVARDNLRSGQTVVIDSVNPWELTREAYREVARSVGTPFLDIEVVCGDADEHRRRVESRASEVPGLVLPTWEEVIGRDYHPWTTPRLVIDTARLGVTEAVEKIVGEMRERP